MNIDFNFQKKGFNNDVQIVTTQSVDSYPELKYWNLLHVRNSRTR